MSCAAASVSMVTAGAASAWLLFTSSAAVATGQDTAAMGLLRLKGGHGNVAVTRPTLSTTLSSLSFLAGKKRDFFFSRRSAFGSSSSRARNSSSSKKKNEEDGRRLKARGARFTIYIVALNA